MKKKIFLFLAFLCLINFSCQKNIEDKAKEVIPEKNQISQGAIGTESLTKLDYFKLLAEIFLSKANSSLNFKKWIYSSCFVQDSGDYYIDVYSLLDRNAGLNYLYWTTSEATYLKTQIINKIKEIDENNNVEYTSPIVFIPFLEDINIDSLLLNSQAGSPKAVISMQYDSTTMLCPGYSYVLEGGLTPIQTNINEDYAWSHDLWVFGQEESVSNNSGGGFTGDRVNGQGEYGGIIQVTNLGALESWVAGKFEFKYIVFNASGTKIKEREFPKVKRKDCKNLAWKDFNDFIAFWNLSNIGNYTIEAWVELDGGLQNRTISQSFPSPCTGCPSTTIGYNIKSDDDNMGQTLVQFSDPITTVYNITHANVKRKN